MVTTRSSWEYTSYALKSFFRTAKLENKDTLYLIDNDEGFEEEASWFSPRLQIIKNSSAQSFAHNVNQVMRIAKADKADLFILHNDIIFTDNWLEPLLEADSSSIVSSISNMHTEYDIAGLSWNSAIKLNEYIGREAKLKELVKQHHSKTEGYKNVLSLQFFCLRVPFEIYEHIGELSEDFHIAGCEDHDYCLRARQAGFEVKYAKKSIVLHFNGKSTWAGGEGPAEREEREKHNYAVFEKKWGEKLSRFLLQNDQSVLSELKLIEEERFNDIIRVLS